MVKVGDTIRVLNTNGDQHQDIVKIEGEYPVLCTKGDSIYISRDSIGETCPCGEHYWALNKEHYQIISSKKENMNLKEKFALAFTKEPQKSFRMAGITNGDDLLTEDGQRIFLSWLLNDKYADEFKTKFVDEILKSDEEK